MSVDWPTCPTPDCSGRGSDDVLGVEIPGVYDGVLYWICNKCGRAFPRDWTGFGRRQAIAEEYCRMHNEHVEAR